MLSGPALYQLGQSCQMAGSHKEAPCMDACVDTLVKSGILCLADTLDNVGKLGSRKHLADKHKEGGVPVNTGVSPAGGIGCW